MVNSSSCLLELDAATANEKAADQLCSQLKEFRQGLFVVKNLAEVRKI